MKHKDRTGQRYGRLVAIERVADYVQRNGMKIVAWLCQCDCGNKIIVRGNNLTSGDTRSCGCYAKECSKKNGERLITHGKTGTRIHHIWLNIIYRCKNKKCELAKNYGGRGIKICEEWKNDFISFYNWSMANGYQDSLSIDRIDVNGNYEPSNCRWVNAKIQANNRRDNHLINIDGVVKTVAEWASEFDIARTTLENRLKRGWTGRKLISPVRKKRK